MMSIGEQASAFFPRGISVLLLRVRPVVVPV